MLHPYMPYVKAVQDDISAKQNCSHLIASHITIICCFNFELRANICILYCVVCTVYANIMHKVLRGLSPR